MNQRQPKPTLAIDGARFEALAAHIDRLLDDETGCPWDRKQTAETLADMLHKETDELIEALRKDDAANSIEETGDLLMLMCMILAKLKARYAIDPNAAIDGIIEKIIRRHTWIFGDDAGKVKTPEDAERVWAENKKKEKAAAPE